MKGEGTLKRMCGEGLHVRGRYRERGWWMMT